MTLSLQKIMLVLLFNSLFVSCVHPNKHISNKKTKKNSIKKKTHTGNNSKKISFVEKKTKKQVPVYFNIFI